jgi:hypothetical protein
MRSVLALLVFAAAACAQTPPLPASIKSAKTVFFQNDTGVSSVQWSAQQMLRGSQLRPSTERDKADLIFHFTQVSHLPSPTTTPLGTKVTPTSMMSLEVLDGSGTSVWGQLREWKGPHKRIELLKPPDSTEKSREEFMQTFPAASLVDQFLKQLNP